MKAAWAYLTTKVYVRPVRTTGTIAPAMRFNRRVSSYAEN